MKTVPKYREGDAVEFTSTRGGRAGRTYQCVIVKLMYSREVVDPRTRLPMTEHRYSVRANSGEMFNISEHMLKPGVAGDKTAEIVAAGRDFHQAKADQREVYKERAAQELLNAGYLEDIHPGDYVNYSPGNIPPVRVKVVEVLSREGKLRIENWKAPYKTTMGKRTKSVVTVWANRCRKA